MILRRPIRAAHVSPELGDVVLFDHDPQPVMTAVAVSVCILGAGAVLGALWLVRRVGGRPA